MAAKGVGYYYAAASGSGIVLGAYNEFPNYVDAAKSIGANALTINPRLWNMLDAMGESWTANEAFLQGSVARGQQIWLTTNPLSAQGSLYLELQFLASHGASPGQWLMVPKPF